MSNLKLTLEAVAGSLVSEAADEAISLADRLNVNVSFSFNGVSVFVTPSRLGRGKNNLGDLIVGAMAEGKTFVGY